uniref:Tectonin beta-propeller repeat-containing protein 2 n=1 Tax=Elaeophora elaphi TaxID=1147741 RepID=A0A0R3RW02_9BILA
MISNDCEESAETDEYRENDGSMVSESGYFSHVDECHALTEQVPVTFSSDTSKTKLTCFDVGHNYIAFGSSCGSLFLFNRRLNRSATPVRTNTDDFITCVKLFSGEYDLLVAGHSSGGLAILNFPTGKSGSTRKVPFCVRNRLKQTLLFDGHKGHVVNCIAWAEDGKKVFSADDAGIIVVTSIDFIHNVFQTTFVSLEHSHVIQLTYLCNLLALCTVKRVAVINENFFDSVLEIDQNQQKVVGIHMNSKSYGMELFVLQSDGFIIIYDISSGEKKRSFSISENVMQKMAAADFSTGSQQWRSCMLAVHSQFFIVHFYSYIVLFDFEDQISTLSSFDVDSLFHNRTFETAICIDPKFPCLTMYVLGPDNRVFRLSSNEAPSYLTEAHEISKEFSSRAFLTSFQKTTKLLPNASKDVFWDGLKVAREMNIFSTLRNFPLPALNAVSDLNCILHNNRNDLAEVIKLDNDCFSPNSFCDQSLDNDSEGNKSSISMQQDKSNISKHFEQMQIQRSNIIENVNKVAQTLVDRVGGFGTQVEDGFLVQPICDAGAASVEETLFPVEQAGVLQEIMVRRTKTAPTNKRKKTENVNDIDRHSSIDSSEEDLGPVDEHMLKNIKGALTVPSQSREVNSQAQDDPYNGSVEQIAGCSEESQEVPWSGELNNDVDMKSEEDDSITEQDMTKNIPKPSVQEISEEGEGNAYEFLMKDALERKPFVSERATTNVICHPNDEQLIRDIVVMNNFSDIWSEIKLPYSYDGSLVWKIFKNVAFAPTESNNKSCSFLTTPHWTVVADEGSGIIEAALTSRSAWYITKSGEVFVQLCLPEMGILSRCETLWPLHSITASEWAVWALQVDSGRLVVRTGLKYSPIGLDWVEVLPHGPVRLISICLYGQSGWAIDEKRSLWFTNGVGYQSPFGCSGSWMKVYNPWDVSPDINRLLSMPWIIRVSSAGVFVCVDHKCYWSSGASVLSGHRLEHIVRDKLSVDNNFELIAGGGLKEDFDCLTLCRINEIFLYRLKNNYFYSLPAFPASFSSNIIEISSFDESVYVLDSSGCIYVKENISTVSPFGVDWKILDTGSCGSPILSFTVTSISLWVVTAASEACLYVKNEKKEPLVGTNPTWIHVKALAGCVFDKIRASSNGMYVWVFSKNSGRAWVRNSITEMFPSGKSWTETNDELGVYDLAVGCKIIWSLSASGQLHRLQGLAIGNRAGNCWKPAPLYLKTITLDRKERLWGIDLNSRLVSHKLSFFLMFSLI